MTEKKDPNAWIEKERQKIQDEVISPMREQLEVLPRCSERILNVIMMCTGLRL